MPEVSTRDLKDALSIWLRRAESGERVVVTRSGKPIAALVPLADLPTTEVHSVLAELQARGMVRVPVRGGEPFTGARVPARGKSAADMVIEDRR